VSLCPFHQHVRHLERTHLLYALDLSNFLSLVAPLTLARSLSWRACIFTSFTTANELQPKSLLSTHSRWVLWLKRLNFSTNATFRIDARCRFAAGKSTFLKILREPICACVIILYQFFKLGRSLISIRYYRTFIQLTA
jgi:hypothetical protein